MIVSGEITKEASYTAQADAAKPKETGAASANLTSNDFLKLLMQELQYQDPLDPVDNKEFIAQQAQFTQLSTTQEMNKNIASGNGATQAASLVGENVTLTDPNDNQKTITGTVSSAIIKGQNSSIIINGKEYPLSSLKSVNSTATTNTANTNTNSAI
jgi:flagellar basal-body rod modification protein FlgD